MRINSVNPAYSARFSPKFGPGFGPTSGAGFGPGFDPGFGKILHSKAAVRKAEGGVQQLDFVEYETGDPKDWKQISRIRQLWMPEEVYMGAIAADFDTIRQGCDGWTTEHSHFYGLEDKNGDTLAIAETRNNSRLAPKELSDKKNRKFMTIDYIQTHPDEMYGLKCRQYKGLGETLVAKIIQLAKKDKIDFIDVKSDNEKFWETSGLFGIARDRAGSLPVRRLKSGDFNNYTDYVKSKTAGE